MNTQPIEKIDTRQALADAERALPEARAAAEAAAANVGATRARVALGDADRAEVGKALARQTKADEAVLMAEAAVLALRGKLEAESLAVARARYAELAPAFAQHRAEVAVVYQQIAEVFTTFVNDLAEVEQAIEATNERGRALERQAAPLPPTAGHPLTALRVRGPAFHAALAGGLARYVREYEVIYPRSEEVPS